MSTPLTIIEYSASADEQVHSTESVGTLILLHAFPLDARMWESTARLLAEQLPTVRIVAVNLPGAGKSSTSGVEPSIEGAAEQLMQTIHNIGEKRVILAGVSMGGYVALAFAEQYGDHLAGLALIDTRAEADSVAALATREAVALQVLEQDSTASLTAMIENGLLGASTVAGESTLPTTVSAWIADQTAHYVAWSQRAMAARQDRTGVLASVLVPVSIIVGAQDVLSPVDVAQKMSELVLGSDLVVVPEAGHLSPVEAPQSVATALADLVARAKENQ